MLEYDGANVLQAKYIHGSGIDEPLSRTVVTAGVSSGYTAVLASTADGLRGPVVDDTIVVNGQIYLGFISGSSFFPPVGQPIDSTSSHLPVAPIDVTTAANTGTLTVSLVDTATLSGNAPVYLVIREQATGRVLESQLLFPARLTATSTAQPGLPTVIAATTVPISTPVATSTLFYHQDGLGTVTELTDSNGSVAKAYAYDAYGNLLESPGTVEQPYTYTGREFDSESGLYYYRARYYDSVVGRFLKKDPIGFKSGDTNLYRYVWGTPTRWIDPVGLEVSKWGRPADLPFPMNQFEHQWLKTDKYEAGMGGMDNLVPGQEGRSGLPFDPTQTVDHTGQFKAPGSHRIDIPFPVDEDCVNRFIRPGKQIGPWTPANQCQSFVSDVLEQCRRTPSYRPLGGATSLPNAY